MDDHEIQLAICEMRVKYPRLMAACELLDRIIDLHRLAVQFPLGESFWACVLLDSFALTAAAQLLGWDRLALGSMGLCLYAGWLLREQLLATYRNWRHPPSPTSLPPSWPEPPPPP